MKSVDIIIPKNSDKSIKIASYLLSENLGKIYQGYRFIVTSTPRSSDFQIRLSLQKTIPIPDSVRTMIPQQNEGFVIKKLTSNKIVISFSSDKGLFNAVYSLVEKLGAGSYLSANTNPAAKQTFSFDNWEMSDYPLQQERIIFNWHNFISGCTGWNFDDWKMWIDQCAKMRFTTIMVHAYGNNPMFGFNYNGVKKQTGYLNTSNSGRDWGAQHINDVQLLPGGEIFKGPVFGSAAATVPYGQRENEAVKLMQKVFAHAREMAMKVIFAVDVDTWSANPQNVIKTLPDSCKIQLGNQYIVNPETREGYLYYKSQVNTLLKLYPEITEITVWKRHDRTLWVDIKPDQFPQSWAKEWILLVEKYPELATAKYGASNFALSKIVKAFQKSLKELNYNSVNISYGSWNWDFLATADMVMPRDVKFIPLDFEINFDTDATKEKLAKLGDHRKIVPIVWAHHDDHRYIGRPYTPYTKFNTLLTERKTAGFGIIHWTTRPLDIYLKSLSNQVWLASADEPLSKTIKIFCEKTFGSVQQPLLQYFTDWITKGPMFGRETSDHFIDLGGSKSVEAIQKNTRQILDRIKERIAIVSNVDREVLLPEGKKTFDYFNQTEQFYVSFFKNQQKFQEAYQMLNQGKIDSARYFLGGVDPEESIKLYTKAATNLTMTTGEKALVLSMGTRWLPDYINLKQRARINDVLIRFGPTKHDSLAQYPGRHTYYIDGLKKWWVCLGIKELAKSVKKEDLKTLTASSDVSTVSWVRFSNELNIPVQTIGGERLAPGDYQVKLKFMDVASTTNFSCSLSLNKENLLPLKIENIESSQKYLIIATKFTIQSGGDYFLNIKTLAPSSLKICEMTIIPL